MTLTLNLSLDKVKTNQHTKRLQGRDQLVLSYCWDTDTHTHASPMALAGPSKCLVIFKKHFRNVLELVLSIITLTYHYLLPESCIIIIIIIIIIISTSVGTDLYLHMPILRVARALDESASGAGQLASARASALWPIRPILGFCGSTVFLNV